MKVTRMAVLTIMVVLCVLSWFNLLTTVFQSQREYRQYIAAAETCAQRKLYELSVDSYKKAAAMKKSQGLYENLIAVSEAYYAESDTHKTYDLLAGVYNEATLAYPKEALFWEGYVKLYLNKGEMNRAASVLKRARSNKVSSEYLNQQWEEIWYAVKLGFQHFDGMSLDCSQDTHVVRNDDRWGTVNSKGEDKLGVIYYSVSPVGSEGCVLCEGEDKEYYLFNANGKMIGRFFSDIEESMGCAEGLIPVRLKGRSDWCYLNSQGEEQFGGFLKAGMFQSGMAAAQLQSGDWCLIGKDGQRQSNGTWEEVRLRENGAYLNGGRVMLKTNGIWGMYDSKGNELGHLAAEDVDIFHGEYVAFKRGGKWGYANMNGEVVLEPSFTMARSFANGVGAVSDGRRWGFVNSEGKLVLDYKYANAGFFNAGGCCPVQSEEDGTWRLLKWEVDHS